MQADNSNAGAKAAGKHGPDEPHNLEPDSWPEFRRTAHEALDAAINHLQNRAQAPVWQRPPDRLRHGLRAPLPREGTDSDALMARIVTEFLPHDVGNTHARFFGWVHGAGTPEGLIPDIFAAAMNANLGGRDHIANEVEKQVISWCVEIFSFPPGAGGLILSGSSMATLVALKAAREKHGGTGLRDSGLRNGPPLVAYASDQAHSCIARAFDILGLGKDALRPVPVDGDFRMDLNALETMIRQDRAAGRQPFCLIGTAGSVNVGAIDPLAALADLAAREGLWFHVDGAFGALAVLEPTLRPRLEGVERADSLAFDFHKWLHVNYDAGFVLMRAAEDQRRAFSERPDYLAGAARGLAAGNPWACEYGPELSRGFRALKIWYQIARFGTTRLGALIRMNCAQAQALGQRVRATPALTLLAPVALNIVCFRFDPGGLGGPELDRLNSEIVIRLQEQGRAAPSNTRIGSALAIRVNLTNHRTRMADLDALTKDVLQIGRELTAGE